ncbi:MAG: SPOR domain-containing protein [Gammaproteobacteria bacterium]
MNPRSEDPDDDAAGESIALADAPPYFLTPQLLQRHELAQHLLEFSDQLLLIQGGEGAGKTAFCDALVERAPDHWRVAAVGAESDMDACALLREIAAALGLDSRESDPGRLGAAIGAQFEVFARASLVPVVLIDDADRLSDDALGTLLGLVGSGDRGRRGHAVLLGRPALGDRVAEFLPEGSDADIVHTLDLPPFTEVQTAEWLAARYAGELELPPDRVREIFAASDGVPARILAALEAPQRGFGAGRLRLPPMPDLPRMPALPALPAVRPLHLVAGVLVLVLAGVVGWLVSRPAKVAAPAMVSIKLPVPSADAVAPAGQVPGPEPLATDAVGPAEAPPPRTEPAPSGQPLFVPAPQVQAGGSVSATATGQPSGPAPAPAADQVTPPAVAAAPAEKPAARIAPPRTAAATVAESIARKPYADGSGRLGKEPAGTKGPRWIQDQKPGRWVLQLFGTYEQAAAMKFIRDYKVGDEGAWYKTVHKGRSWYVVVYGLYSSRTAAAAAVPSLPPKIKALKPFPRSIADLRSAD